MAIVLVNKRLTTTDITSCLSYPAGSLRDFRMGLGHNAVNFNASDPTGRVWQFRLSTRNHGGYQKPVIRGEWLRYVREKGLAVDDFIILTMVQEGPNGATFNIRFEAADLELAL